MKINTTSSVTFTARECAVLSKLAERARADRSLVRELAIHVTSWGDGEYTPNDEIFVEQFLEDLSTI